ncbi:hypothetical protein LZP69_08255 [Shewanella sp. AS1]|uniref:hypothetical protein n=1 Tax=Shewanella sp. AS1 TaxID=2907626 RepID=UPI001F247746|nr:hypothetical protein [Shewanella sp. AS1]MCE9679165.1 hypothetical protein [Shewanella sp. AS1]
MEKDKQTPNGDPRLEDQSWNKELKQLYQAQANEEPGSALDKQILARAKAHSESSKTKDAKMSVSPQKVVFWRKYRWTLSSAASAVLLVSLLLVNQQTDDIPSPLPMAAKPARLLSSQPIQTSPVEGAGEQKEGEQPAQALSIQTEQIQAELMPSEPIPTEQMKAKQAQTEPMQLEQAPQSDKTVPKLTMSDKQALYHLSQLVNSQQWQEASKLLERINQERPQLADKDHPQHQEWRDLSEAIELAK